LQIKIDPSSYSKKFHDVIYSWDRYIIAYGGRGSGKTDSIYLKYLVNLFEPYYFKLAYINKEATNIRDQQYAGFKRVAKRIGLYNYLRFYDGDYRIINPKNGNSLIPKGMDDPEKTKGLDNITAIWWDEINKGKLDDFLALNELLRSPEATYLQFAMSFNPVYEKHWLRNTFFSEEDPHALAFEYSKDTLLNRSTYRDNEFIDQESYLQTLMKGANENPNTVRVNVEGDWGLDEPVDNPWLHAWEDKYIDESIEANINLPYIVSVDFNLNPFCGIVAQIQGKTLCILDEFSIDNGSIPKLIDLLKTYPRRDLMRMTGDAMGNRGSIEQRDHSTSYQQIQRGLMLRDSQFTITANPRHDNSRVECNTLIRKGLVKIHSSCKSTIFDFNQVASDEHGKIVKKNRGQSNQRADHLDAFRYICHNFMRKYL